MINSASLSGSEKSTPVRAEKNVGVSEISLMKGSWRANTHLSSLSIYQAFF
jgi:hypothetical protein